MAVERSDERVDLGLHAGRELLRKLQVEVGWDPMADEPTDPEVLEAYIAKLESTVVGQHAAMQWTKP
jgi:hypothetical protein